jgi:hypothetical protein
VSRRFLIAWMVLSALLLVLVVFVSAEVFAEEGQRGPLSTWLTWGWRLYYDTSPVNGKSELARLHESAHAISREQCTACHGTMLHSKLPLHRIHLRSPLLPGLACHECHQRVDLTPRGNTAVVTWVDVGFCKKCHSSFPGLASGTPMKPSDFNVKCTKCHVGKHAPKHKRDYLARDIPVSECRGCHGGRVLPWTPLHERPDWLSRHGAEALRAGMESCFACHDFGLKFCDACHATKPQSHQPAERWKAAHVDAARKDTRVCYACHRTSYCKRCHVNHEAGWMKNHPAYLRQHGDSSCRECHSTDACTYCHAEQSNR